MTNFSEISTNYERDSLVQKAASDHLFELVSIKFFEDVLDIGCGTGNLTRKIAEQTSGRIVGIDASEGMINAARRNNPQLDIEFKVCPTEQMNYTNSFDVIFCNSTFQWFKDPKPALEACRKALKPGGRMGIQSPAREIYSPNFIEAIERVKSAPLLKEKFESFRQPWFFLETPEEYTELFETAGFEVVHSRIDQLVSSHTPDEVHNIFESGASAGYLNQKCYSLPISDNYVDSFRRIVRAAFKDQANSDGHVDLTFFRIYLLAKKPSELRINSQ